MVWGSVTFLIPATLSFASAPTWEPPPPDVDKRVKVRGGSVYCRVNGNLEGPKCIAHALERHRFFQALHSHCRQANRLAGLLFHVHPRAVTRDVEGPDQSLR